MVSSNKYDKDQTLVSRKGDTTNTGEYQRINSTEDIFNKLKEADKDISLRRIEMYQKGSMGKTDGLGTIGLRKDQYEAFYNAVDKLLQGKVDELTPIETQATLTYWHERTHNLTTKSYSLAKYIGDQKDFMESVTEFIAQNTLPEFYKMFGAEMPAKINLSSGYANTVNNYTKAVSKFVEIGGIKEQDVIAKTRQHFINGGLEDQRAGFINALYGAKINEKIINRRTLGIIVDNALKYQDFQFEKKLNKILGLTN